jgi:hypothetical protein
VSDPRDEPFTLRDVEMMMDAASGRIVEPELFDVVHEQVSAELAF